MTRKSVGPTPIRFLRRTSERAQDFQQLGHSEQGATIVETALSMGLLLGVLLGIMEACLALYSYHFVSEAAREGTRYAIVRGSTSAADCPSNPVAACPATQANIESYVSSLGYPGIDITAADVSVAWSAYPVGSTCTPSASCNNPGDMVQVTVTYPIHLVLPFASIKALTLSSRSQMVISQ
jgi:Flp pilus assembly protein TadG